MYAVRFVAKVFNAQSGSCADYSSLPANGPVPGWLAADAVKSLTRQFTSVNDSAGWKASNLPALMGWATQRNGRA
jgi:hypothetical protein